MQHRETRKTWATLWNREVKIPRKWSKRSHPVSRDYIIVPRGIPSGAWCSEGHLFHVSYSHCGSLQKGSSVRLPETVRERSINISSFSAANKSINEFTAGDFRFPFS